MSTAKNNKVLADEQDVNPGKKTGDISGFSTVSVEIDELRAKMKELIKTTTCVSVETADHHLMLAMSALEEYFEWAGCYDDEPEVKAMTDKKVATREEIDAMWDNLHKRIAESDEPIKVTGIMGPYGTGQTQHYEDKE